ncbi:MAG: DUF192 domain-containing protein [Gammaproteobacteria bacterium]|nr:DUF192 domain-containing protein [Gammaproteobacteria bacterium]MBU6510166.1 DUF192 domain-containing protein [Gammaproteobacteria bacterium]MDE1984069.1 DUF192 domain-containing protein [Gammaproteobacteria bacterium]MDE2108415.1 DUF192 domain-containing protein [Gammaproteobacteria bacterium]
MKHFFSRHSLSGVLSLLFAVGICLNVQAASLPTKQIELAHHHFTVEVANTDAERERGLMFRVHMADDHGMLFVFPDVQPRYFWMKNTLIPLDIIFFDAHKRLINVSANTPPCKVDPCPTYGSTAPAKYVLELNAGMAAKLGLKAGDKFTIL